MSLPATDGFREAVTEGHSYARQLFVCESTGRILEEVPIDPATSINVGPGLVRRSGTIVIPNRDDRYTPTSGGLVDFGRAFLLRFLVTTNSGRFHCDQPLLFPDSDEVDLGGHTVTIPVSDAMRIVSSDAQVAEPVNFRDGTSLDRVVRRILVACGAPDDDDRFDLRSGGAHVVGDHGYEVGAQWADILNQLLIDHSCDLWAAPPAVYTLRPTPDPATATPVATWQLGRQVRLIGLRVKRMSQAKNHAIVEGLDAFGRPFTVEVFDRNPASPVMYGKTGVGDLSVRWKSDGISSPDQARAVGRSLLTTRGVQRTFDAAVPIDPSLDCHDVIRIAMPTIESLAMLQNFPVPAAPGAQQITVNDARVLA